MKTIQINSVCGYGSTGKIAVDISRILQKDNIENYVLYGVGESDYKNGVKFGGNINLRSHQIKTRLLGKHAFYSKIATKSLIKKIKNINPDIIHLHNLHGHYLNVELLFEYLSEIQKPVIWTLHDCWSFTGHCAHFDYVGCEKWKTECHSCPQLLEYPKSLIFDRSRESYRDKKMLFTSIENMNIVTPSNWLNDMARESFLSKYEVTTINNGIDTGLFRPVESDFKKKNQLENKYIILGVANFWGKKKGYDYFLELSKEIEEDEVIVLIGVTKSQKDELPKNMIGITRTDSISELVEIYSEADVFVNPTLEEVFGLVNVESIACGTPVVTFDTGGSPETIDESTGIVVARDDIKGLIKAKDEVKLLGKSHYKENCINRAKSYFDKNDKYKEYSELYRKIL